MKLPAERIYLYRQKQSQAIATSASYHEVTGEETVALPRKQCVAAEVSPQDIKLQNLKRHSMKLAVCILAFLHLAHAGTIKVCAETTDGIPMVGAKVVCKDYDPANSDDFMAQGETGIDGCISLNYRVIRSWWPGYHWDGFANNKPDIYCEIEEECFTTLKTPTLSNQHQTSTTDFGTLSFDYNEAYCGDVSYNGCGAESFPNFIREFVNNLSGFEVACNNHDICYSDCSISQNECDNVFLQDMVSICMSRGDCLDASQNFFSIVQLFGSSLSCGG